MTVYLITQWSDDGYQVLGAAPSREEADAIVARMRLLAPGASDQPDVEEYEYLSVEDVRGYSTLYLRAHITREGDLLREDEWVYSGWDLGDVNRPPVASGYYPPRGILTVSGEDHGLVRKVYSEKLAALVRTAADDERTKSLRELATCEWTIRPAADDEGRAEA